MPIIDGFTDEQREIIKYKGLTYNDIRVNPRYSYVNSSDYVSHITSVACKLGDEYRNLLKELNSTNLFVYALYKLNQKEESEKVRKEKIVLVYLRISLHKGLEKYFGHVRFY